MRVKSTYIVRSVASVVGVACIVWASIGPNSFGQRSMPGTISGCEKVIGVFLGISGGEGVLY